jgi:uncharacterized protein
MFVSVSVQALPFLVLGVLISGAIAALVPPGWLARALPDQPLVAVPDRRAGWHWSGTGS